MQFSTEIIRKKRNGVELTAGEIRAFVHGIADGSVSAEQISAMAMAIYFRLMTLEETCTMTVEMAKTGVIFSWKELGIDRPTGDKHSTGGVGDKVSLILAPIVAACGVFVPMMAGRGLGHTGGTLDKLEAIPGFKVNLDDQAFVRTVREIGCAIIGQSDRMVAADKRFYAIRDVTETVGSIPLITASILSKKIAAGPDSLVIDLKVGTGAFMESIDDARRLAKSLSDTARQVNLKTTCLLTDMNQILGKTAGNALEVYETIDYLNGNDRDARLHEITIALAARMLCSAGVASHLNEAAGMAGQALESGAAREVFARMVAAQGGPLGLMDNPEKHLGHANVTRSVFPMHEGRIATMDVRRIGNGIVALGGGRIDPQNAIDHSVGLSACAGVGDFVDGNRPICQVHASDNHAADRAARLILDCVQISSEPVISSPTVIEQVGV